MRLDTNTLLFGDNLEVLREYIEDESIDLIYIDPPFKKQKTFNILYREPDGSPSEAQTMAYADTWYWNEESEANYHDLIQNSPQHLANTTIGLRKFLDESSTMAYLVNMAVRIQELYRVLKSTGSFYLHCDPTSSHYLKIILDSIFGEDNFRNEIVWCYKSGGASKRYFSKKHDVIFFYSKTDDYVFNPQEEKSYMAPGSGKNPQQTYYEDENGIYTLVNVKDWWTDIGMLATSSHERLGYPTQKPKELLEKIILASSDRDAFVLDAFCGCGTTISAAERLGRHWIGIDVTHLAISLIKHRLKDSYDLEEGKDYQVIGEPVDLTGAQKLADKDKHQFEYWALGLVNARPPGHTAQGKKGADKGIDGFLYFIEDKAEANQVIVQVKAGHVTVSQIRDLQGTMQRESAPMGIFITLESPTRPMIKEAASAGVYHSHYTRQDYPKIQIMTIEDLLNGIKPNLPPSFISHKEAKTKSRDEQLGFDTD